MKSTPSNTSASTGLQREYNNTTSSLCSQIPSRSVCKAINDLSFSLIWLMSDFTGLKELTQCLRVACMTVDHALS